MSVFYIVLAIFLFGVLILAHEFGHFITAKLSGIQVNEFSLFMGPAIWKRQKGETLYALRCIPIGGFCAMEGEDGDSDNPRAFVKAKVWKRLIVLAAGSIMNLLCGFLILVIVVATTFAYIPSKTLSGVEQSRPFAGTLLPGDEFYAINGERVYVQSDITMLLDMEKDGVHDITVIRDGEKVTLEDVTMRRDYDDGTGARYGITLQSRQKGLGSVLGYTWNNCIDFVRMVRLSIMELVRGNAGVQDLSGPVGIVSVVTEQATSSETVGMGIANVLYLFAFIAINLAVMNLLPIPALDGGRIVCLLITALIEKIIGRKLNPKYEGWLHAGFMVALLALMLFVTFKDIFSLFGG